MKKTAIACLIAGIIFIAIGTITVVTSFSMGVAGHIKDGIKHMSEESFEIEYEEYEEVKAINFELNAADVEITNGEVFSVKYPKYISSDFSTYVDGTGVWHMDGKLRGKRISFANFISYFNSDSMGTVYITIPYEAVFDDVNIVINASNVSLDSIDAKDISLEVNAGNADFGRLTAANLVDIKCEAGNVTVSGSMSSELSIKADAGNVTWSGNVLDRAEVAADLANIDMDIAGTLEDYTFNLNTSLGTISINDIEYTNLKEGYLIQHEDGKYIYVETNLGNIDINTAD